MSKVHPIEALSQRLCDVEHVDMTLSGSWCGWSDSFLPRYGVRIALPLITFVEVQVYYLLTVDLKSVWQA